jgi:starvation-inducible outer membrane lipoprotein
MKKFILVVSFALMLTGCAAVGAWTKAQADCASDPSCLEEARKYAAAGQAVASPWGPVAGGAAASVITFIALGILGLKKKKV